MAGGGTKLLAAKPWRTSCPSLHRPDSDSKWRKQRGRVSLPCWAIPKRSRQRTMGVQALKRTFGLVATELSVPEPAPDRK